jgi:hypothetical protein
MQCHQFERLLEDQDAGSLPAEGQSHLADCGACRSLIADLNAIHDMAAGLDDESIAPPERVWTSLRNQLEAEGLIRTAISETVAHPASGWWTLFQRPALAGAFLSVLLAAAALVSYQQAVSPNAIARVQDDGLPQASVVPAADSVFREEALAVGDESATGARRQDTAVTDSIHRNLRIVDNFIALCEKSVREQPDNPIAKEYLYGAYQQKAELLATAMDHGAMGGIQ